MNIESHSVSLFGDSDNDSLSCLPLVTCRLVETVRFAGETERPLYDRGGEEKGAYEDPRKWILLCIFVSYDSLHDV